MARGHLVRNGEPKSLNDWIWVDGVKYYLKDLTLSETNYTCRGCLLLYTVSCSAILATYLFGDLLGIPGGCRGRIVTLKPKDDAE